MLWIANAISSIGNWFTTITLLDYVSGSPDKGIEGKGIYVSLVFVFALLPQFLISPIAGVVADKFNRKTIMIVSDIVRGCLALGFLAILIIKPQSIIFLYVIEILLYSTSAFFSSSESAILPSIVRSSDELYSANALDQITWGLMLAVGASLAGWIIAYHGYEVAFIIDSLTFFFSAFFILRVRYKERSEDSIQESQKKTIRMVFKNHWLELKKGVSYILNDRYIIALLLVKPGWALGGGAILMLHTIFGKEVFKAGSEGISILYMSRGLGVIIGGFLGQWLVRQTSRINVLWIISVLFILHGLFYASFSRMPDLFYASLMLVCATAFSANLWLLSQVTLQEVVPAGLRGRVFAHDDGLSMLAMMSSAIIAGWFLDHQVDPRTIALTAAIVIACSGLFVAIGLVTGFLPKRVKYDKID